MPASKLDAFLSWAIPAAVILIFAGLLYVKMKAPVDQVFKWIGKLFSLGLESIKGKAETGYERVVRYD